MSCGDPPLDAFGQHGWALGAFGGNLAMMRGVPPQQYSQLRLSAEDMRCIAEAEDGQCVPVTLPQQCGTQFGPLDPHGQGGVAGAMAWLGARSAQPSSSVPTKAPSSGVYKAVVSAIRLAIGSKVAAGIACSLLCGTAWGLFWWGYCVLVQSLQ